MSYDAEKAKTVRAPLSIVSIDLDSCGLVYGSAPCTAAGAAGAECYNTLQTCQDPDNYTQTVKEYQFYDTGPAVLGLAGWPNLDRVSHASGRVEPGTMGVRAKITANLQTMAHNDAGTDPYADTRSYNPRAQGDALAKMRARHPFYVGRPMRWREGFLGDGYTPDNFRTRHYIIDRMEGPNKSGAFQIIGKDILKFADDDRAEVPAVTNGVLAEDIDATALQIAVPDNKAADYAWTDYIRIDDELLTITGRTGGVFSVTRETGGSEAKEHSAGADVVGVLYLAGNPVDIIETLLKDHTETPHSFIDVPTWTSTARNALLNFNIEAFISEPIGVRSLIDEILSENLLSMWYDERDQKIRLQAETGYRTTDYTFTDYELLDGELTPKDNHEKRITRIKWNYNIRNAAKAPDFENTAKHDLFADPVSELPERFGEEKIKTFDSRWIPQAGGPQTELISNRYFALFGGMPRTVTFELDARHADPRPGDIVALESDGVQGPDGAPINSRFLVLSEKITEAGKRYRYEALAYPDPIEGGEAEGGIVITANQVNFNLANYLQGPIEADDFQVTVVAGVTIQSDNPDIPAFTTGSLPEGSTVKLIFDGDIGGMGGAGAAGSNARAYWIGEPSIDWAGTSGPVQDGGAGGDAIHATVDLEIDTTTGRILGAGGGGGAEAGVWSGGATDSTGVATGGDGGGGGQSITVSTGGAGGTAEIFDGTGTATLGTAGGTGDISAAGLAGGAGAGAGGLWGAVGANGSDSNGGAAGLAIKTNGYIITYTGKTLAQLITDSQLIGAVT